MTRIALLALLVWGIVGADVADATTWKVGRAFNSCDGPCNFDDTSVGTPLGGAIATALQWPSVQPGDTVEVWPGDYFVPLPMASGVVLRTHAGLGTVRVVGNSGTNAGIFMAACNELTLIEDFVVNWGQDNTGGGLVALASSGTVRNCIFRNCRAATGAAVYQQLSDVRLENNLFIDCQATAGGGVIALSTADPTIINNTFSGSTVPFGSEGATVYSIGADFIFDRNIVVGSNGASAIYCQATAAPVITCNIFWDNEFGPFSSTCSDSSGASGNISADPLICDIPAEMFGVCVDSPALTGPCGTIGYTSPSGNCPACGTTPTGAFASVSPLTWGSVKALYRR